MTSPRGANSDGFVRYRPQRREGDDMRSRSRDFFQLMDARRSVRDFSSRPVARELIEQAIATASTAPSGAHRQPWRFVAVDDPGIKRRIREAAEEEERRNYAERMPDEWLEALRPIGTGPEKPYLERAPWIVVAFEELYGLGPDGEKRKNYYVKESVGIACGLFIAALHQMGLQTLTHTPSPMRFLSRILQRPDNEKPYILFPIGYAAADAQVPDLKRKTLAEVSVWNPGAAGGSEPGG